MIECKYYYRYYGKILSVLPSIIYNASHVNIPPFLGASGLLSRGRHKADKAPGVLWSGFLVHTNVNINIIYLILVEYIL